jgi:hypothetical protein
LIGFKQLFSEVVSAKWFERMVKGIELKVWIYNLMLGLALAPLSPPPELNKRPFVKSFSLPIHIPLNPTFSPLAPSVS